MSEQAERHHIRWGLEEVSLVAQEARNLFPNETNFTLRHFQAAQKTLPTDRQKQSRNWVASMMEQLASLVPPPSSASAVSPFNNRNGQSSLPVENLAIPEAFADLLSRQIAATLLAINIKTLELTLERLRAHQALDSNGS